MKNVWTKVTAVAILAIVSCGNKKFTCSICNEEKNGKPIESELMGEKILICDECYEGMKELLGQ